MAKRQRGRRRRKGRFKQFRREYEKLPKCFQTRNICTLEPGAVFNFRGYWYVRGTGTPRALHRAIVEAAIGELLNPKEHVHHINGDKRDNRLSNLQIVPAQQHMSAHNKQRTFPLVIEGIPTVAEMAAERERKWRERHQQESENAG